MKTENLKKGEIYYCLIGDNWYPYFGIVKAKYISNAGWPYNDDLVVMEQNIDGVIHRFEADTSKIYSLDKDIITAILHNEKQTRRIIEHDKTFDHQNAREKVEGWIATLLETDQKALRARYREVYPALVKPNGKFLSSKFKMKDWNELMHLYFDYKYPKVKVPEH